MSKGYMYILECADGSYYTGSTKSLEIRIAQHQAGEGANHTKKRLPVKLVYFEEYQRIDEAFYREKQVQGWSRKKKETLINGVPEELHKMAGYMNASHYSNVAFDSAQATATDSAQVADSKVVERSRNHREKHLKNQPKPEVLEGKVEKAD